MCVSAWMSQRCVQGGVCHTCVSFLFPLPSPLPPQNRGKEARATLNSSAALDNVCAGKKKCRLRFYNLKTITQCQAPCRGQSLPCPGRSLQAWHCSEHFHGWHHYILMTTHNVGAVIITQILEMRKRTPRDIMSLPPKSFRRTTTYTSQSTKVLG